MKNWKKRTAILMMMFSILVLLFTACGGETAETASMGDMEETVSPQDDPNEGLGGDLNEDTVNDFSSFEGIWYDDGGNEFYSWNSELYQRNVSEFEGVWYYDGDLAAETFLVIDGDGNWSYYQRAPGDAEATEMDCGIFTYSTDEVSTYYADSTMYDGVSIRVFEFDDDVLIWGDEGAYYLME